MNAVQQARQLGQSVWLDYIRRGLLKSGELKELVGMGVSGLTANPTILEKAIAGSTDYDDALADLARHGKSAGQIYDALAIEDIQAVADLLRPVYDRTSTADGYPCLEISPLVAYDTEGSIREARRLFNALARPNVMVKVPATPQGMPVIRQLTAEGINVNVTLIFSLEVYEQVKEAYITGLEEMVARGGDPRRVASVASFFLSRIDTAVDALLEDHVKQGRQEEKGLLGRTAIASAKLAYSRFQHTFRGERFAALRAKGARAQRLLWASTGTKNPAYSDLMYVEPLIGPGTVNTMPLATLQAFIDHGVVKATVQAGLSQAQQEAARVNLGATEDTLADDVVKAFSDTLATLQSFVDKRLVDGTVQTGLSEAQQTFVDLEAAGIGLRAITDRLLADGVKAFSDSFEKLMAGIEEKKAKLLTSEPAGLRSDLGSYGDEVKATMAAMGESGIVRRIWQKDHTVWKPDPAEISNRLGWLTVSDVMREQLGTMASFGEEVRRAGFRHVVLLGMGGSSLGAEVLRQVFGSPHGYPRLVVLDSTVPAAVLAVARAIEPGHTLFLVSSKSGTTTEPQLLFEYFKSLVGRKLTGGRLGQNFVSITDPGTPLVRLAEGQGFRRVFLNPPDIGGRYSVLSCFGLVPAALTGIDIVTLLERADRMREGCASCVDNRSNPGAWLGACMGAMARKGRDKLTLVTSPAMSSFGLWAEQLIAESTGKEGKGIVPIAGEPLLRPQYYGNDRWFVYLRLKGDQNEATDAAVKAIMSAGLPVVVLDMADKHDLGAEFFRWQLATAVAGALLDVNPFDQPDVQRAKEATMRLLQEYSSSGQAPDVKTTGSLPELLADMGEGKYLAIMAYIRQTPEMDKALGALRRVVAERYRMATTLGYGPRYLHSTGQLHKGGPNTGLFLQITAEHEQDLSIPGRSYSFGIVADAQAAGDFQALQAAGRRVVRIHLPKSDARAVSGLLAELV
ncbi:MAG: transaldolase [Dehalococcoidia bacterium]|nr:transaldolase [Dehalococcoidia bacterium]